MKNEKLNVKKILEEFRVYEESPSHRKGRVKIEIPLEEAMKKILKAKPEPKPSNTKSLRP